MRRNGTPQKFEVVEVIIGEHLVICSQIGTTPQSHVLKLWVLKICIDAKESPLKILEYIVTKALHHCYQLLFQCKKYLSTCFCDSVNIIRMKK